VLKVDTGSVRSVSQDLARITAELDGAAAHSDDVADAVGHDGLAGALRNFAGSWDDRRRKLVEQISHLQASATAIADAFDDTDTELARALRSAPSVAPAAASTGTAHGATAV